MMHSAAEWESSARELGLVVEKMLDEYKNACYGSEFEYEALAALTTLNWLLDVDRTGIEPAEKDFQ